MCEVYGWDDPPAIVDAIAADLRQALANHEQAKRVRAVRIFGAMVEWMAAHADALKA